MLSRSIVAALAIIFISSCSHTKKLSNDIQTVTLDTLTITASRENPYRASETKYFDLKHTKLEVSFDYQHQYLFGKATITLKPHFEAQHTLTLDAKQFEFHEVSLVKADNSRLPLAYTYDSLQLKITLDRSYTRDETLKLFIDYTAKPEERKTGGSEAINSDKGLYFINPLGTDTTKPIQIWTQGETESNSCWFPTIDKPNQKMTDEIYITHLKKYVSLSNGLQVSSKDNGDSTVTDYWKMDLPHPPYLIMMAIGDFAVVKDRWRDIAVDYYVEKDYEKDAKGIFGNTPQMMEFFSQKLGFDYPWQKYAQVIVRDYVSGAMENTTATLHGEFLQRHSRERLDETYEDVVSHELFHQWFGDLLTTESWSNIPLNESFATYGEYLWNEYKYGKEMADYKQWENYEKFLEEAETKNVDLVRFYYEDREDMFDRHSYEKGGLLLHYLRNIVGDEAFFKSLELYLKANQFKNVEIHQLRLAFEEVTGRDLNWFFNQWFLSSGYPLLDIKYSVEGDSVQVAFTQTQNNDKGVVYTLPMRFDVYYEGGKKESFPIELKKKRQSFAFKVNGTPLLLDADGARVVLCQKTENKTPQQYIYQYHYSPVFVARYEALEALVDTQESLPEARVLFEEALMDSFFYLRKVAVENIFPGKETKEEIVKKIATLAVNDPNSLVREAAIDRLSKLAEKEKYTELYINAVGDSSYLVEAAALKALNKDNGAKAMELAKKLENEKNDDLQAAVADVYASEGDAGFQPYFEHQLRTGTGISKYYLFYYYANFLTRMEKPVVLTGIATIEEEGVKADGHFIQGAAKGALKRINKSFEEKKKRAQADLNKEESQTAKLELQEKIGNYDEITAAVTDALKRMSEKQQAAH